MVSKPFPLKCCTEPPSWSVVISSRLLEGAYDCNSDVAAETPVVPEFQLPMINTEPTCWSTMRSRNVDGSDPAGNGAITSWPIRSSRVMASTARTALPCGESSVTDGTADFPRGLCVISVSGMEVGKSEPTSPEHADNVSGSAMTHPIATKRLKGMRNLFFTRPLSHMRSSICGRRGCRYGAGHPVRVSAWKIRRMKDSAYGWIRSAAGITAFPACR